MVPSSIYEPRAVISLLDYLMDYYYSYYYYWYYYNYY